MAVECLPRSYSSWRSRKVTKELRSRCLSMSIVLHEALLAIHFLEICQLGLALEHEWADLSRKQAEPNVFKVLCSNQSRRCGHPVLKLNVFFFSTCFRHCTTRLMHDKLQLDHEAWTHPMQQAENIRCQMTLKQTMYSICSLSCPESSQDISSTRRSNLGEARDAG
ncbi:hypothetical protein TNCV_286831 [Trichonephila clavipes]|nr:hypothetical protein TNCV_286831 [Trichonephila clavipes]